MHRDCDAPQAAHERVRHALDALVASTMMVWHGLIVSSLVCASTCTSPSGATRRASAAEDRADGKEEEAAAEGCDRDEGTFRPRCELISHGLGHALGGSSSVVPDPISRGRRADVAVCIGE